MKKLKKVLAEIKQHYVYNMYWYNSGAAIIALTFLLMMLSTI